MSGDKDNGAAQVAAARSHLGRRREVYLFILLFSFLYFFSYASRRFWLTSMAVLGADVKQILDMREDEVVIE
jgi:hypothetical protein